MASLRSGNGDPDVSALGQKQTCAVHQPMSALPPESGHSSLRLACPLCANSGHAIFHSNNSSARPERGSGTVMPSALAVFRLMYRSTLVTC